MENLKVYVLFSYHDPLKNMSDEEYKKACEQDGRVFTLENFELAFNEGDISDEEYIRFLAD